MLIEKDPTKRLVIQKLSKHLPILIHKPLRD